MTMQIDRASLLMKKQIEATKLSKRKELHKHSKSIRFINTLITNGEIFFYKNLYIGDIPKSDPKKDLDLDMIYSDIQKSLNSLLNDRKMKPLIESSEQMFGFFEEICNRVTSGLRKRMIISDCISIASFYFKMYLIYCYADWYLIERRPFFGVRFFILLLSMLGLKFTSSFFQLKTNEYEYKINLKMRHTMNILIYDKLILKDTYFLECCDNTMISKAFFEELEDFINYKAKNKSIVSVFLLLVLLGISCIWEKGFYLIFILVVGKTLIVCGLCYRSSFTNVKLKGILFKQRAVIYEFLNNFKSIRSKNLSELTKMKLVDLHILKKSIIRKSNLFEIFSKLIIESLPLLLVSIGVIAFHFSNENSSNHEQDKTLNFTSKMFLFLIIYCFTLGKNLMDLSANFEHHRTYKSSKVFYTDFFNNKFMIESCLQNQDLEPGTILLEECQVFERDRNIISELLQEILSSEDQKKANSRLLEKINKLGKYDKKAVTKILNESNSPRRFNSIRELQSGPPNTDRLKLLFQSLSFSLKPGDKLCILQPRMSFKHDNMFSMNQECIRGFVRFILGDCILSEGKASICGRISYFNPLNECFLSGMTIRDNILYGSEFNLDRYGRILEMIQTNFYQYFGRDFYQVAERAKNIKLEDKRLILLARFLYSNSDIYIIEDYLTEQFGHLNYSLINEIISRHLRGKTVIFNSNILEYIKLSNFTIKLKSKQNFSIRSTNSLLEKLNPRQISNFKKLASVASKSQIMKTFKNSLFIQTAGFEEELIIHKKLEKQKKEIEEFAKKDDGLLVKLSHGIVLTNRRMEEGRYFSDNGYKIPPVSYKRLFRVIIGKHKMIFFTGILALILSEISFLLAEYSIMVYNPDFLANNHSASHKKLIMIPVFACLHLLLSLIYYCLILKVSLKTSDNLSIECTNLLISCDLEFVERTQTNLILNTICTDMDTMQRNLIKDLILITSYLVKIILKSALLIHIQSYLFPLIVFSLFFPIKIYCWKLVLPSIKKLLEISNFYDNKILALCEQLLTVIPNLRRSKLIPSIDRKFRNFINNKILISRCMWDHQIKYLDRSSLLISFGFLSLQLFIIHLIQWSPGLNWVSSNGFSAIWSCALLYRISYYLHETHGMFLEIKKRTVQCVKISDMIESLKSRQKTANKISWFRIEFDLLRPIIFKNVSLTLGYQPVLKKVSFNIKNGERIGIFGLDVIGRKSIFEILLGLKRPDSEKCKVSIFGVELDDMTKEMFSKIFMIEREPKLLEGTIRQNIDPYGRKTLEEIIEVLTLFRIDICYKTQNQNILEIKRGTRVYKQINTFDGKFIQNGSEKNSKDRKKYHQTFVNPEIKFGADYFQKRDIYLFKRGRHTENNEILSPMKYALKAHQSKNPSLFTSRVREHKPVVNEHKDNIISANIEKMNSDKKLENKGSLWM